MNRALRENSASERLAAISETGVSSVLCKEMIKRKSKDRVHTHKKSRTQKAKRDRKEKQES